MSAVSFVFQVIGNTSPVVCHVMMPASVLEGRLQGSALKPK